MAIEMADRVSARRGQANQFYVSLETLIVGVPALLQVSDQGQVLGEGRGNILSLLGIIVAAVWWLQLRSYRDLNKAKFEVITEIEQNHLPIQIFKLEWDKLSSDLVPSWRSRYAELGTVERLVPVIFILINFAAIGLSVYR
ncbi:RipA family octameric membrane protein [Rhodococcus qingshengii]